MDKLNVEILEDGTVKVDSGPVSPMNHMSAESFLRDLQKAAGAKQERKHKQGFIGAALHALAHASGVAHHHH
jgi:hypothetical protein